MDRVDYERLQEQVLDRLGQPVATAPNMILDQIMRALDRGLQRGWEKGFWPELLQVDQRAMMGAKVYPMYIGITVGQFYWHTPSDAYYRFIGTHPNVNPSTNPTEYAPVVIGENGFYPQFERYPSRLIVGLSPVAWTGARYDAGAVKGVYRDDPRLAGRGADNRLTWELQGEWVLLRDLSAPRPWCEYRVRAPRINAPAFSATTIYAPGAVMRYTDGTASYPLNFYECVATAVVAGKTPKDAGYWQLIEIPKFLEDFLGQFGYAQMLLNDGQNEKRYQEMGEAERMLARAWLRVKGQEGQ